MDVEFILMNKDMPTLLSLRDMLRNNLDISIRYECIKFQGQREPLIMDNYCLIYRWAPHDMHYALYTEGDLRRIHHSFGHPRVTTTVKLLKRASGEPVKSKVKKSIATITKDCETCRMTDTAPKRSN